MCEIENDHFTYDYQSTVSGWLAIILAENGAKKILPGETIAVLAEEKEEIPAVVDMIHKEIKAGTLRIYSAPAEVPIVPVAQPIVNSSTSAATTETAKASTVSTIASNTMVAPPIQPTPTVVPIPVQEDEVTKFLHSVHAELVFYAAVLKSDGFDSVDAIDTLKEQDLEKLGMKTGHRRILMNYLEKRKPKVASEKPTP